MRTAKRREPKDRSRRRRINAPLFPYPLQVCEAHDPKISAAKVFVFAKQMLDAAEQVSGIQHGSLVQLLDDVVQPRMI